jgi:2-(1,2-epoxy-1,2-dihydrophenyl)acetyl-CoA isomerase
MDGSSTTSQDVLMDVSNGIAVIRLNRPEKLNSFTDAMVLDIVERMRECGSRDDINGVVLTGSGRAFSSGGDVSDMEAKARRTPIEIKSALWNITQALPKEAAKLDKPLIAAVNGAAVGGGADIALMCDLRVASRSAKIGVAYSRMGLVPGVGAAYFLPRLAGPSRALELLWTSEFLTADRALEVGIVDHVFDDDSFEQGWRALAEKIAGMAPITTRLIKRAVYQGLRTDLRTHLDLISSHMAIVRTTEDHAEAVAAHKEKRKPTFVGR